MNTESTTGSPPEELAIVGATILDGNGGTPIKEGVVVVKGSRILAVGDQSTPIPPQAKQLAASGKFVIPGLMSAHAMLVDCSYLTPLIRYEGRFDEVAIEAAQLALRIGVTTVFDDWGPRDALIKAREAIKQGRVVASRVYLAGNMIGVGGPFSVDMKPLHRDVVPGTFAARIDSQWQLNVGRELQQMSPEQVREEIRRYVQSGIDFVSCGINDRVNIPPYYGCNRYLMFSSRVLQLIVEEAHRAGLVVYGWTPSSTEGLVQAVNAGIDHTTIMWLMPHMSEEAVELLAQRQIPCAMLGNTAEIREWYRQRLSKWPWAERELRIDPMLRRLIDAGVVPMLPAIGSVVSVDDMESWGGEWFPPGAHVPGTAHTTYLQSILENGASPMEGLMAATRNIAKAYKVDKDLGTLERGKLADLVILDKDPLKDTKNYLSISVVIKEGKIIDRDALPTHRLITAPPPKSEARAEALREFLS